MTIDNYLAEAGAFATLSGILAGFAISAVIQLLSSVPESKIATATIVTYSASTAMFLYTLIVFILVFAGTAEQNKIIGDLDTLGTIALLVMYAAVFVFLAAIGMTGWIRSRITGILTSSFAMITMCLIAIAILSVTSTLS